jgi:two-component system, response regulator PdtaR
MNDNDNPDVDGPETPPSVLVVEDEFLLRMMAAEYLEEAGFPVIQAANAADAIDQLKVHDEIGVVFTDVEMPPGMNGLDLARWISRERPDVKVLVSSGKVPRAAVTDRPFLPKPYHMREVERLLRAL